MQSVKVVVADILMVKRLLHGWYHDNLALFSTTVFVADAEH